MINDPNIAGLGGSWVAGGIGGGIASQQLRGGGQQGVSPGGGLMNVTIGNNVISKGYSRLLFGSVDTDTPSPPIPPAGTFVIIQAVVQLIGLDWALTLADTRALGGTAPAQNVFTDVTFTGGSGPITLLSSAATYVKVPMPPNDFQAQWLWPATVDVWFGLADSTVVTATFT